MATGVAWWNCLLYVLSFKKSHSVVFLLYFLFLSVAAHSSRAPTSGSQTGDTLGKALASVSVREFIKWGKQIIFLAGTKQTIQNRQNRPTLPSLVANKNTVVTFRLINTSRKLPNYPSPKPAFCPKWQVSVNVGLGGG